MSKEKWKLCFVEDFDQDYPGILKLYFTPLELGKQWGDDWNDRPYEHNAGEPYTSDYTQPEQGVKNGVGIYPRINIKTLIIEAEDYRISFYTPRHSYQNSPYSVEDINNLKVPWIKIQFDDYTPINLMAGMEYNEIIKICQKIGIKVYIPQKKGERKEKER